jgi:hypothetical protein
LHPLKPTSIKIGSSLFDSLGFGNFGLSLSILHAGAAGDVPVLSGDQPNGDQRVL